MDKTQLMWRISSAANQEVTRRIAEAHNAAFNEAGEAILLIAMCCVFIWVIRGILTGNGGENHEPK